MSALLDSVAHLIDVTVAVDAAGIVTVSGEGVSPGGDITCMRRDTSIRFTLGGHTSDRSWSFEQIVVVREDVAIDCPPQPPYPPLPSNNEFTLSNAGKTATLGNRCTERAGYNYALVLRNERTGARATFDPRIINNPT
jgi:hypothetical protein